METSITENRYLDGTKNHTKRNKNFMDSDITNFVNNKSFKIEKNYSFHECNYEKVNICLRNSFFLLFENIFI